MVWFKSCPRCEKGDISHERDLYGERIFCLQCGYDRDVYNEDGLLFLLYGRDILTSGVPATFAAYLKEHEGERLSWEQIFRDFCPEFNPSYVRAVWSQAVKGMLPIPDGTIESTGGTLKYVSYVKRLVH